MVSKNTPWQSVSSLMTIVRHGSMQVWRHAMYRRCASMPHGHSHSISLVFIFIYVACLKPLLVSAGLRPVTKLHTHIVQAWSVLRITFGIRRSTVKIIGRRGFNARLGGGPVVNETLTWRNRSQSFKLLLMLTGYIILSARQSHSKPCQSVAAADKQWRLMTDRMQHGVAVTHWRSSSD